MNYDYYMVALHNLKSRLQEMKKKEDKDDINFFTAVGMATQEIKHSSFLAWLLSFKEAHDLKSKILEKLLDRLYDYQIQQATAFSIKTNEEIIRKTTKCLKKEELLNLVFNRKNEVKTEVVTEDDKRIDILVDIPVTKTVVIIENKIFTKSHDNQLINYQNYINGNASGFNSYDNKIYIYLSPEGEVPINYGGNEKYNDVWCIFDYRKIIEIVDETVSELKNKQCSVLPQGRKRTKLISIMEDYRKMIKTNILFENPNLLAECKEILDDKQLREAFELLTMYTHTATEDKVLSFVRTYLGAVDDGAKSQRIFYTEAMKNFFECQGEKINNHLCRCVFRPVGAMGGIVGFEIVISLEKMNGAWTKAQEKILKKIQPNRNCENNRFVSPPNSRILLLSESEQGQVFEKIEPNLKIQLERFKIALKKFEKQLEEIV